MARAKYYHEKQLVMEYKSVMRRLYEIDEMPGRAVPSPADVERLTTEVAGLLARSDEISAELLALAET